MHHALTHTIWLRLFLIAAILCSSAFLPAHPGHAAFPIAAADPAAVSTAPADAILVTIGAGGFSLATLAMTLGQAITWRNETTSPQVVQIQTPTSLPDDGEPTLTNKTFLPMIHQSVVTAARITAATHPLDTAGEVTLQPGQEVSYTVTKLGEYRFQLRDQTAAMAATVTAPDHLVLFHIGNQVAPLGSTLTIDLRAYDPAGATLRFGIAPLPLPARMNMDLGSARFTFRPTVDQTGSYTLTFAVTAGEKTVTETVQITVPAIDPTGAGGTALRGRILDANQAAADAVVPLVGATVRLVDKPAVSATTDSDGYFLLTGLAAGENYVEFDGSTATPAGAYGAYRSKQVLIGDVVNTIDRPIYIMAVDLAGQTMLDPNSTTTVNNPNVNTTMVIPPQTVRNDQGDLYAGPISISEVPADFTPSSLPDTLDPGMVLTIQPMGLTFAQPAPITLPNIDHLPAGSAVDIWSMDHETAQFFIAGKGMVSADGTRIETVEGGIRESSWHFPMPPVANPTIPPDGTPDNIGNGCQTEVSSTVDIAGGCLRTTATLPTYTSLGQDWGIELIYSSERAYPQPLFPIHFAISGRCRASAAFLWVDQLWRHGAEWHNLPRYQPTK
ncbi:MAG: hypothetical protein R3E79_25450 [Caldilineaceae bacterium]